jgi:hypothetical protein
VSVDCPMWFSSVILYLVVVGLVRGMLDRHWNCSDYKYIEGGKGKVSLYRPFSPPSLLLNSVVASDNRLVSTVRDPLFSIPCGCGDHCAVSQGRPLCLLLLLLRALASSCEFVRGRNVLSRVLRKYASLRKTIAGL